MKDEGGRMKLMLSKGRFNFIPHPSAFIPSFIFRP
jgi:hypothetical protein